MENPEKQWVSKKFKAELSALINKYNLETEVKTPDFILADYLCGCLKSFHKLHSARVEWQGDLTMRKIGLLNYSHRSKL